jgi:hypothetical protein
MCCVKIIGMVFDTERNIVVQLMAGYYHCITLNSSLLSTKGVETLHWKGGVYVCVFFIFTVFLKRLKKMVSGAPWVGDREEREKTNLLRCLT